VEKEYNVEFFEKVRQIKMRTLEISLAKRMEDPEFKAEYEALEPEFDIIQAIINARKKSGFTQKQLSEKTGIAQGDISKIENGEANPSLKTLKRLASGMNARLHLQFISIKPKTQRDRRKGIIVK